jgi:opacity protein-like surface antigen
MGYIYTETSRFKGFTFGTQFTHREYTTTINADGGKDLERKDITADALTAMVRYYPVDREGRSIFRALQPFAGVHAGYEVATDSDEFITAGQAGLEINLLDNWSIEGAYTYWVRPADRNYKTTTIGLKWRF